VVDIALSFRKQLAASKARLAYRATATTAAPWMSLRGYSRIVIFGMFALTSVSFGIDLDFVTEGMA